MILLWGILISDLSSTIRNLKLFTLSCPPTGRAVTFSLQLEKITRPMYRAAAAEG